MSHARYPAAMEAMRARFVEGATGRGETHEAAARVFDAISNFVGYGFCRSHAAEFGKTIYATAWLKAHYPAHYLAAFLSAQPAGFFPPHVVLEEARQLGIPVLPPDVNRGEDRFTVERVGSAGAERWAIRVGLRQVAQVGEELAEAILWERRRDGAGAAGRDDGGESGWVSGERPFASLADLCARLRPAGLDRRAAAALVLAGACDSLPPRMTRRQRLWQLHEVWQYYASPARGVGRSGKRRRAPRAGRETGVDLPPMPQQLALAWEPTAEIASAPPLPAFSRAEAAALDYQLLGMSPRPHPMRLLRHDLRRRGVRAIADLAALPEGRGVRVAGWAISAQRPPTAKGMGFVVLEDETGCLPVAVPPRLAEQLHRVIREARVIGVAGRVERVRWYRSLLATELRAVG